MTHTFVILDLSPAAFGEISRKLNAAGYQHAFMKSSGRDVIDMQGIAVACEPVQKSDVIMPSTFEEAVDIFHRYGGVSVDKKLLLTRFPATSQLNDVKSRAVLNGVPSHIVERAAELVDFQPYSNPAPPASLPVEKPARPAAMPKHEWKRKRAGVKILRWTGHAIATAASLFCVAAIWCLDCTMRALMGGDQ